MKTRHTNLQLKPSEYERKKLKRKHARDLKEEMESKWHKNDMRVVLEQGLNFSTWDKLVYRQSFTEKACRQARSHVPTTQTRDTEQVLSDAREWPADEAINWSKFARDHGVPGQNGRQVVKEFLRKAGVDVLSMEKRAQPRAKKRRSLEKFGCGVSFPAHKRAAGIKGALPNGELNPGEECCGTLIANYTLENSELARKEVDVQGRKISMLDLRGSLLRQHEARGLMRPVPPTLENYACLPRQVVTQRLFDTGEQCGPEDTGQELPTRLFICQSQRLLMLQSDHADVLGHCCLMEVVQVIYDRAIFLTDDEFEEMHGRRINTQAAVEAPVIRLFAMIRLFRRGLPPQCTRPCK